jgi:hypothetical protein
VAIGGKEQYVPHQNAYQGAVQTTRGVRYQPADVAVAQCMRDLTACTQHTRQHAAQLPGVRAVASLVAQARQSLWTNATQVRPGGRVHITRACAYKPIAELIDPSVS